MGKLNIFRMTLLQNIVVITNRSRRKYLHWHHVGNIM